MGQMNTSTQTQIGLGNRAPVNITEAYVFHTIMWKAGPEVCLRAVLQLPIRPVRLLTITIFKSVRARVFSSLGLPAVGSTVQRGRSPR